MKHWLSVKRQDVAPLINTHGVGMAAARPYGFRIDYVRNPISGSTVWFFLIILKSIFTIIFETKIHEKKFLDTKKNSFSKVDFHTGWQRRQYLTPTAWELT